MDHWFPRWSFMKRSCIQGISPRLDILEEGNQFVSDDGLGKTSVDPLAIANILSENLVPETQTNL
jgi:hypothetical protein